MDRAYLVRSHPGRCRPTGGEIRESRCQPSNPHPHTKEQVIFRSTMNPGNGVLYALAVPGLPGSLSSMGGSRRRLGSTWVDKSATGTLVEWHLYEANRRMKGTRAMHRTNAKPGQKHRVHIVMLNNKLGVCNQPELGWLHTQNFHVSRC